MAELNPDSQGAENENNAMEIEAGVIEIEPNNDAQQEVQGDDTTEETRNPETPNEKKGRGRPSKSESENWRVRKLL